MEQYNEILKLKAMLEEAGIVFARIKKHWEENYGRG